jgi:hypothetical protein
VPLVRTDVSEELSTSFIRVTRIGELGTTLAVTVILVTLMKEALSSSETSVLTRATQHNIPEDAILLSPAVKTSNPALLKFQEHSLLGCFHRRVSIPVESVRGNIIVPFYGQAQ